MKVGLLLPVFRRSAEPALRVAIQAEELGLDGVFVPDVLAGSGQTVPALAPFPFLGAVGAQTSRIALGSLVARVGVVATSLLVREFETLQAIAGDRVIAGLGAGDKTTPHENAEYQLPFRSFGERVALLDDACRRVKCIGLETWLGGLSTAIRDLAVENDVTSNLWGPPNELMAEMARVGRPWTWAGIVPDDPSEVPGFLKGVIAYGPSWCICAPRGGADQAGVLKALAEIKNTHPAGL